jgi:pimeloyl-ACP methyl ester carboxylesterase
VRHLVADRRLVVLNRWPGLPDGLSMAELATGHADAIRAGLAVPVDVIGMSTGGSIALQLAADHPDTVRRLALLSTACRLSPFGRASQSRVAALLRAGKTRPAVRFAAGILAPRGLRGIAGGIGWLTAQRVITNPQAAADLIATIGAEDGFDLARCRTPIAARTLLIAGARDRFYSRHLFEATAALIPNSTLRLVPGRGHLSVTRDRGARAALADFLAA